MDTNERIGKYRVHPVAEMFPPLPDDEYEKLKTSIKISGQHYPIFVQGDVLLDGRNRLKAILELKMTPKVEEYHGNQKPEFFIESVNLDRRFLSKEQQVMISAKIRAWVIEKENAEKQKAAGAAQGHHGAEGGRGKKKPLNTKTYEGVSEPQTRDQNARSTVGQIAKVAEVSHHKAAQAVAVVKHAPELADKVIAGKMPLLEASKKAREVIAAPPVAAPPAPPAPRGPSVALKEPGLLYSGWSVQRTRASFLEFAALPQPVSRADVAQHLGGTTPRNQRREFEMFFNFAAHLPWATVEKLDDGFRFTVNQQLLQLCDQHAPLPELNGWSAQEVVSFLRGLRRTITEKRAANKCERHRRQWNPDDTLKLELLKLVEFIETELDKFANPSHKFPPAEGQAEKRLAQPSAGDADPPKGDSYVN